MKKILIIPLLYLLMFTSCNVLDVDPFHNIPADIAIVDADGVERGIIGCYDALQSGAYYGLDFLAVGDLAADNLTFSGVTVSYAEINNNNILADNGLIEGMWASMYRLLSRINNVVVRIPAIQDMSQAEKNRALAELRFLRALAHYDLMRMFGPVPIRTEPATADEASLNFPRHSIEQVLLQINADLGFAIEHMGAEMERGRASKAAAQALKARVALHQYYITQNNEYLNTAIANAGEVINNYGLSLEPDYANLFTGAANKESIFEVDFNEQDGNRLAQYFFHTSLSGRYEFAPTASWLNSFADEDSRKGSIVRIAANFPFVFKYNDIETGTDNVYVLRLAEMHLIRAEAMIKLEGDTELIRQDINAIRERAGLVPTTITGYPALFTEVETQRRKEFAFEGHRWFDLVRTGRAIDVLENVTNINQTLFPIPLNEILANDNPGMGQNPGY